MNIAAVIDNLGPSQNSFYLIKEFNQCLSNKDICVSVFFERSAIPVLPVMFSTKNISFLSGYHDIAIATSIKEASTLLKSENNSDKYLYLWDIEWLIQPQLYDAVCEILLDNRLNIIARSQSHADLIYNFCNKNVSGVVDNWNMEQLTNVINEDYLCQKK